MADVSSWNKNVPSGSSRLRDSDDQLRSDKSLLQATWETEHYFSSSSLSGGVHRPGSARVYVGTASQVSLTGDSGRLMFTTDEHALYVLSSTSSVQLPSTATIANNYLHKSGVSSVVSTPVNFTSQLSKVNLTVATVVLSATTPVVTTEGLIWLKP